jgi:hypothetical protein
MDENIVGLLLIVIPLFLLITFSKFDSRPLKQKIYTALGVVLFPSSLAALILDDRFDIVALVDVPTILIVFYPTIITAFIYDFGKVQSWAKTFLAFGVPLGLIGSYAGVIMVLENATEPALLGNVVSILLLTALLGGIISAIGYAAASNEHSSKVIPMKLWQFLVSITNVFFVLSLAVSQNITPFLDSIIFLIFSISIASFLLVNRRYHWTQSITHASLYVSIIITIVSLVYWFSGYSDELASGSFDIQPPLFAANAVFWGAIIYLIAYNISLYLNPNNPIDAAKTNWHLLEVNTFLFFLAFAPSSLSGYLQTDFYNKQTQEKIQQQEERIKQLEEFISSRE